MLTAFVKAGLVASTGEARRQIKGGGLRVNDAPVTDEKTALGEKDFEKDGVAKLSLGKKKHVLLGAELSGGAPRGRRSTGSPSIGTLAHTAKHELRVWNELSAEAKKFASATVSSQHSRRAFELPAQSRRIARLA